jgi:hypothetical protein
MYKYYFHIIDNEYGGQYDYEGYFDDHFEADRFITENEAVGNVITMVAPYYEFVSMDEVPSIYKD